MAYQIIHGDCIEVLKQFNDNCIDALGTDPPYGLSFMNRAWDKELPGTEYWEAFLRILKPGAHGVVMGAPKKAHRLGCIIEDSGFEIRDCIMWLYGSGFPKGCNAALNLDKHFGHSNRGQAIPTASTYQASDTEKKNKLQSNAVGKYVPITDQAKEWDGFHTGLKPAYEPIFLIRKPLIGTVAENVLEYRVGVLNINACRVGEEPVTINRFNDGMKPFGNGAGHEYTSDESKGRWPANICHDGSDEALAGFPKKKGKVKTIKMKAGNTNVVYGKYDKNYEGSYLQGGSVDRYFYCSKASRKEKEAGLEAFDPINVTDGRKIPPDNGFQRGKTKRHNTHPTVKPISLCRWLSRLICPTGGTLIDPFAGSGSLGIGAILEGFNWIGIEQQQEDIKISEARLEYWYGTRR